MASQARHHSVSPQETSASRYVVPQGEGKAVVQCGFDQGLVPDPVTGEIMIMNGGEIKIKSKIKIMSKTKKAGSFMKRRSVARLAG
jgi:hypothetical protein